MAKVGGVGDFGKVKVLWEDLGSVCVPSGSSGWDVAVLIVAVVGEGANVPTVERMC